MKPSATSGTAVPSNGVALCGSTSGGGLSGLLGLLANLTGGELRLRALKASGLSASAQGCEALRSCGPGAVNSLAQALLFFGRSYALAKLLLPQVGNLLGSRRSLAKALLANAEHLPRGLLLGGAVGLSGRQAEALLLLGGLQGLPVALAQEATEDVAAGHVLLALEDGSRNASPVAAKSALADSIAGLASHGLLVLLV